MYVKVDRLRSPRRRGLADGEVAPSSGTSFDAAGFTGALASVAQIGYTIWAGERARKDEKKERKRERQAEAAEAARLNEEARRAAAAAEAAQVARFEATTKQTDTLKNVAIGAVAIVAGVGGLVFLGKLLMGGKRK
ncbi:MAG: hypothetical protein IT371_30560 [Deltaproteobacteria bacterium]|nr:hypothetical protein [Deltaproteobacteria bacterium]